MHHLLTFLTLLTLTTQNPITTTEDTYESEDPYRLPGNISPTRYNLLVVFEEDFGETASYTGEVTIQFSTTDAVNNITLHALDLTLNHSATTLTCNGASVDLFRVVTDEDLQMVFLETTGSIVNGSSCSLHLEFGGVLHDDMDGLYRSSYRDEDDRLIWIATSQFQPTSARRAFPCFDEPALKARFTLRIVHPADFHALTNTLQIGESETYPGTNLLLDTFQETPIMSTYLLAIVVSPFGYWWDRERRYRVFARTEANATLEYSFEVGPKLLQSLESFTGIDYLSTGIGKMDQVAVPDFSAGAMENWGLVTYREILLLWDSTQSTRLQKQNVATVISHEFGHMWFGNLVTCAWWNYLWLNEGFARYFEFYTTDDVETTWELDAQFVIRQVHTAFSVDSLASSRALNADASSPAEIISKFSTISYNKGGSIIRMMEHFMGHENFREGLQRYLTDNEFQATVPTDLFNALQPSASNLPTGKTLEEVMDAWINQAGYPVLEAKMSGNDLVITQRRFFYNTTETSETKWDIPITYATSHEVEKFLNTTPDVWFPSNVDSLTIPNILHGGSGWIVLNVQQTGYYRVNYDEDLWKQIETALKSENFGGIHVINRAQIINDVMNFARGGQVSYTTALNIVSYLSEEVEYFPWFTAFNEFSFLRRRIGTDELLEPYLTSFLDSLMGKIYESVPFNDINDEDHVYSLKKALVLLWACQIQHSTCVDESKVAFQSFIINGQLVNPNVKQAVYCTALRHADSSDWWYALWDRFTETKLSSEQTLILWALGCTTNRTLLGEYLQKSISADSGIRSQDASTVFQAVYDGNLDGVDYAFEFLRENYREVIQFYGSLGGISNIITGMADRFTREQQVEELQKFLDDHQDELEEAALVGQSAIETARANIAWTNSFSEELHGWFTRGSASKVTFSALFAAIFVMLSVWIA